MARCHKLRFGLPANKPVFFQAVYDPFSREVIQEVIIFPFDVLPFWNAGDERFMGNRGLNRFD